MGILISISLCHVLTQHDHRPAGYYGDDALAVIRQYWRDSYGNIRWQDGTSESDTVVLIHDAFQEASYWGNFMTAPDFQGVAIDTHIYQVFEDEYVAMSEDQHISLACQQSSVLSQYQLGVIVWEWCPAITDCAKYLNGRGVGARYDGTKDGSSYVGDCSQMTGSGAGFSDSYKVFLRKFWEAQMSSYETGYGWIQWTWKTEDGTGEEWSYEAGLKYGWIPSNPTERQYPNICN